MHLPSKTVAVIVTPASTAAATALFFNTTAFLEAMIAAFEVNVLFRFVGTFSGLDASLTKPKIRKTRFRSGSSINSPLLLRIGCPITHRHGQQRCRSPPVVFALISFGTMTGRPFDFVL